MPMIGVEAQAERLHKRWILGALGIAFTIHVGVAGLLGWYKIPGLEVPADHSAPTGPFTVKSIEINPDALNAPQKDPTQQLPSATAPQNPAEFNLDPAQVEKALQSPQPALATPAVPEPAKVIAATDLSQSMPMVESDASPVTAEIAKMEPTASGSPVTSSKLAQDLLSSSPGPVPDAVTGGTPTADTGKAGKLPGFADLAPGFKTSGAGIANLPDPVLLRLPSDVLFDFDSAQLKPEAAGLLSQAIALIVKYPEADIHIDGYSDSIGQPDYNVTLSQQRSEAVQAWFQQRIAQPTYQFKSQGHGSTNFIVSAQGSIAQQQPNRRVEILIQATKP